VSKVVIGTVHPGSVDAKFCQCLLTTVSENLRGLFPFRQRTLMAHAPAGMLHTARNEVVRGFLEHPFRPDYLMFIDTDMTWDEEQIGALYDTAETHDLPAVSALIAFCQQEEDGPGKPMTMLYDYNFRFVPVKSDVQRVFCSGMGFMLLRRDALERCGQAHGWPTPWFDYGHRNGKAVSEDVIFSQRLWDLGIPIHVDTRVRVGHRKTHGFKPAQVGACFAV
jgi:hypothetical protein